MHPSAGRSFIHVSWLLFRSHSEGADVNSAARSDRDHRKRDGSEISRRCGARHVCLLVSRCCLVPAGVGALMTGPRGPNHILSVERRPGAGIKPHVSFTCLNLNQLCAGIVEPVNSDSVTEYVRAAFIILINMNCCLLWSRCAGTVSIGTDTQSHLYRSYIVLFYTSQRQG